MTERIGSKWSVSAALAATRTCLLGLAVAALAIFAIIEIRERGQRLLCAKASKSSGD
jgi:hypothetical protein